MSLVPPRPLDATRRPVLGVQTEKVPEGVRLTSVTSGSAADKAKLTRNLAQARAAKAAKARRIAAA